MTWVHSTPGRSSRRKQHHRRTTLTPQDRDTTTYDDDYSADTKFDQPANDDNASASASPSNGPSDSATDQLTDRFSSALERNKVRKESCSASNSNSTPLSLPRQPVDSQTAYNPCMNIAQFPIFCGGRDDCPFAHLSRFSKVCRANNVSSVDMMTKIFPATLEEEAALWYDLNIEPYEYELSWEETKSSFSHAYGKIQLADQLRSQLMTINQGEEESVRSYFLRLQWILKKWPQHGLSDDLLKGVFVDGLRSDFQEWMAPEKPSSLNEALRLAFCFEQVKSIRDVRRNVAVKCGFCSGSREERGCEIWEKMRELWLKNKDDDDELGKRMLVGLEWNLSGKMSEGVKEPGKSFSMATSASSSCVGGRNIQVEEGELGLKKKKNSRQCQCGKHQCWKKNYLERNNSIVSGNFKGE